MPGEILSAYASSGDDVSDEIPVDFDGCRGENAAGDNDVGASEERHHFVTIARRAAPIAIAS
jgi:hypothetical protein